MNAMHRTIKCFAAIPESKREEVCAGVDLIFFETSLRKTFDDAASRDAFRHTWVGQYLKDYPDFSFVAMEGERVIGYLAGYVPVDGRKGSFADQHHMTVFADLHSKYPAHLHINVAADHQSTGVGSELIAAFVVICTRLGVSGVHVVTGNGSRNNAFYRKVGFVDEVPREREGRSMMFMGRPL